MSTGVRSGVLLAVIGLWLLMRATHQDATGRTLINHILDAGNPGLTPAQVGAQQFRAQVVASGGPTIAPLTSQEQAALAASISPTPTPANMGALLPAQSLSQFDASVLGGRPANPKLASAQAQIAGALAHLGGSG